jgi:hypothetical protein
MAKPRGDGNDYGIAVPVADLPDGWQRTGQFITDNDQAYRHNRDQQRQRAVDAATDEKGATAAFNNADILDEVAWADGDIDKLNAILIRLGGTEKRYASDAVRAIQSRLNAQSNTYGRAPQLTKAERAAVVDDWDWNNLNGVDLPEAKRLSGLATQLFGSANAIGNDAAGPLRRAIEHIESNYFKGAQVPPDIQARIQEHFRAAETQTPDRARAQQRPLQTRPTHQLSERSEARQTKLDKDLRDNAVENLERNRPQHRLSDAEREAQRARRRGRQLRPIDQRLGRN